MTINVCVADDHTVMRDGLRYVLEAQPDIRVVGEAADGLETVRMVKRLGPAVVVMDIAMPKLNGIEATHRISEENLSTRVLILSMHANKEFIFRALRAGAKGYILKEAAGREVVQAVRAVNAGQRYLSQRITEQMVDEYILYREAMTAAEPLERLSPREREVLQLVVEGYSSIAIADTLHLSPKTVDTYRSRLMEKLDVSDLPGLVKFALRHGIITLEG